MTFIEPLLRRLVDHDKTTPRIVWYGPDLERIELSGRVLDNWVSKTANLLVDEFDVGVGDEVAVLTPRHWRSTVFALATWAIGARLSIGGPAPDAAAVFTAAPSGDTRRQLAVALPGLAMGFAGDVAGALDYNAEVRSFPDVFTPWEIPAEDNIALSHPGGALSFADIAAAIESGGPAAGAERTRVLLPAGDLDAGFLLGALGTLHRLGTVIVTDPSRTGDLERIAANEGVTA